MYQAVRFTRPQRHAIAVIIGRTLTIAVLNAVEPLVIKTVFDELMAQCAKVLVLSIVALCCLALSPEVRDGAADWLTWRTRIGLQYALLEATIGKLHKMLLDPSALMEPSIPIIPLRSRGGGDDGCPACVCVDRQRRRFISLRPHMRCLHLTRAGVLATALLLAGAVATGQVPLSFGTAGGDAWAFSKSIVITIPEARCDQIVVTSPVSSVTLPAERGRVHALVSLQPGDNRIRAECREHGVTRGAAQQTWNVRLRNVPTASVRVSESDRGLTLDAQGSVPAAVRASAISRYEWRARDGNPAQLADFPASRPRIELSDGVPDGEYYVTLKVTDHDGRSDETTIMFRALGGILRAVDVDREHALWIDRAVIYGVVPALFGPRGLADVTVRLDQLRELGVTALWLSPITGSPPGDFGYAVTDYFHVRRSLGNEGELHDLIQAAHARGIRVIIDFVPNHLSDQHVYFADTVGRAHFSPYFGFFDRAQDGSPKHYFNWSNLKNLNYANPEVQRLVIEAFAYWVREFDVDGFRVDAAWGPKQRAPEFWPRWRAELKRIKPDLLLLAEASAGDPYYGRHGFDAAYDWTGKLGEWAWQGAFDDEPNTARRLRFAIEASESDDLLIFRFLENNDTGPRFRSRYGLDRTRIAAAMLLTLPGIPGIFTGEEVGAAYEPYKDAHPIAWDDGYGLRNWYGRLIALRRDHPALRSRDIRMLDVPDDRNVLAYLRSDSKSSDRVLVLLNYGASPARISIASDLAGRLHGRRMTDLLSGEEVALDDASITMPGKAVRMLKLR
ncbi:alpha-amylase family glycosyl hydrolase [Bradyrhizobium sp. ISRA442]|uniref:alpha-amylase family glycosyl hydrolase n=1 Tax=Bradyrhizobium sp. ISRA442 TaxID=2866197 RepID=UPI00311B048C